GQRAGQQLGHPRRVGPVLDGEHVAGVVPRRGGQQGRPPGGGPGVEETSRLRHGRAPGGSFGAFYSPASGWPDPAPRLRGGLAERASYREGLLPGGLVPGDCHLGGCPGPGPAVTLLDHLYPNVPVEPAVPNMPEADVAAVCERLRADGVDVVRVSYPDLIGVD